MVSEKLQLMSTEGVFINYVSGGGGGGGTGGQSNTLYCTKLQPENNYLIYTAGKHKILQGINKKNYIGEGK